MPKLLQKNILKSSIISFIAAFLLNRIIWMLDGDITTSSFFYAYNLLLWAGFNSQIQTNLYAFSLPDYMFIAPYSREQRKRLLQKGIEYEFWAVYIWQLGLVVAPLFVRSILLHDMSLIIFVGLEIIISASIIYSDGYAMYLSKVHPGKSFFMTFFRFIEICILRDGFCSGSGVSDLIDLIIFLAIIIHSVGVIIICRVKFRDEMISCMADYEYVTSKINKK